MLITQLKAKETIVSLAAGKKGTFSGKRSC